MAESGAEKFGGLTPGSSQKDLYRLAYDEGRRTVDDQLAELDSMRQRSVQFLSFVGAATAFLVGTGLKTPGRSTEFLVLASIASAGTVISIVLCLMILVGTAWKNGRFQIEDWSFRLSARALVQWIEPDVRPPSETEYLRALALRYSAMADENAPRLARVRYLYMGFLFFGFVQLCAWMVLVWVFG